MRSLLLVEVNDRGSLHVFGLKATPFPSHISRGVTAVQDGQNTRESVGFGSGPDPREEVDEVDLRPIVARIQRGGDCMKYFHSLACLEIPWSVPDTGGVDCEDHWWCWHQSCRNLLHRWVGCHMSGDSLRDELLDCCRIHDGCYVDHGVEWRWLIWFWNVPNASWSVLKCTKFPRDPSIPSWWNGLMPATRLSTTV